LKSTSFQSNSVESPTTNGLSLSFPSYELPVNLSRGPTPREESFKLSRRTLDIASVVAGSNADKAQNTLDDNELTDWASDGKPENAWIRYELASPNKIDQIVLKPVGWRTQSYPVKVSIDDKVVFAGTTPRSLGYVTIRFPPAFGRTIRIELAGEASNRDAFGNIIEITGTPDPQSSANRGEAKTLGIVEAEFYSSDLK
jgi:beta-galactosidase